MTASSAALGTRPASSDENTYRVRRLAGTYHDLRERLNDSGRSERHRRLRRPAADVLDTGAMLFRARNVGSFAVMRDLRNAANLAVQSERLRAAGISASAVQALIAPVTIDEAKITARGEERGGALSTFLAAYVVAFLTYLMTTLYGVAVMRSVLEEKTNRIAEVLMSTIRAPHLIAGKIVGVGSAAVAQVLIWVGIMALVVTQSHRLGERFALPPTLLQALSIEPATGVLLFLFFLLGFFLYAAVFATVGASVTSEQEAQSVQFIALIPLGGAVAFSRIDSQRPSRPDGDDARAHSTDGIHRHADAHGVDAGSADRDCPLAGIPGHRHCRCRVDCREDLPGWHSEHWQASVTARIGSLDPLSVTQVPAYRGYSDIAIFCNSMDDISLLATRKNISPSCHVTTAGLRPSMSSRAGSGPSS